MIGLLDLTGMTGLLGRGAGVLVRDTFDRANSTTSLGTADTGQVWTAHVGTWGILDNKAYQPSATASSRATVEAGNADGAAQVVVRNSNWIADGSGLSFRRTAGGDQLLTVINSTTVRLFKVISGAFTLLASVAFTPTNDVDYTLKATFDGADITVLIDEVQYIAYTLTAAEQTAVGAGTRHGLFGNQTTVRFDDFRVAA